MKTHTPIKFIKNNFRTFRTGYCELKNIMKYTEPQYYNSGVYGWNCDVYISYKHDIAITTGYRNMTGQLIPREVIEKYNNVAMEILTNKYNKPFEEVEKALAENMENFYNELAEL